MRIELADETFCRQMYGAMGTKYCAIARFTIDVGMYVILLFCTSLNLSDAFNPFDNLCVVWSAVSAKRTRRKTKKSVRTTGPESMH